MWNFFKYNPAPQAWTDFHLALSALLGFIWEKLSILGPSYKVGGRRLKMPCSLIETPRLMMEADVADDADETGKHVKTCGIQLPPFSYGEYICGRHVVLYA